MIEASICRANVQYVYATMLYACYSGKKVLEERIRGAEPGRASARAYLKISIVIFIFSVVVVLVFSLCLLLFYAVRAEIESRDSCCFRANIYYVYIEGRHLYCIKRTSYTRVSSALLVCHLFLLRLSI